MTPGREQDLWPKRRARRRSNPIGSQRISNQSSDRWESESFPPDLIGEGMSEGLKLDRVPRAPDNGWFCCGPWAYLMLDY